MAAARVERRSRFMGPPWPLFVVPPCSTRSNREKFAAVIGESAPIFKSKGRNWAAFWTIGRSGRPGRLGRRSEFAPRGGRVAQRRDPTREEEMSTATIVTIVIIAVAVIALF